MKRLLSLLLALAPFYTALADTFTVTSNANSGPGTLREALTLANANGTVVPDNITFNIADISISGRTILLLTSLPDLTSNLVIDGTTQPGSKIGISDAKIRITNPAGVGVDYVFRIFNKKNIGIYGLHFHAINTMNYNFNSANAILLHNADNISIGASGKGNYFTNLSNAVADVVSYYYDGRGMSNNFSFKANIVNLTEDGTDIATSSFARAISLSNVRNVDIGGEQPGEGNYMSTNSAYMVELSTDSSANLNMGYIKVLNNKLGCNYTETRGLNCGTIHITNANSYGTDTSLIIVKGNSFNAIAYQFQNSAQMFLHIERKLGFIDIKANKIGLLGAPTYFNLIYTGISIAQCGDGIIGGDNPADTNFIAGCYVAGIGMGDNKNIRITKNSLFCNFKGIQAFSNFVAIPKTQIFTITDYEVKGTTLPNSVAEVFLTNTCLQCDNGKTYLGSTTADAAGNWSFISPVLLDGAVSATGTSQMGVTGEFARPEYTSEHLDARAPTCNQPNGYIHGLHFVSGTKYYWTASTNNGIDTIYTENLDNIGPGYYSFIVEQGKYCAVKFYLYLGDNSPHINALYKNITQPKCGLNNGSITSHGLSGSYNKIIWKDTANNIISNSADLNNAGPGKYKLLLLDTVHGCGDSTAFYTLVNRSGPSLNTGNVQVYTSSCSKNNGSITGIAAVNITGTPFIQWVDSLNKPAGNGYDLINALPGKYRLKFQDAGGCDTIITSFYTIPDQGAITIDTLNKLVTASKCSGISGSIKQVNVTGAETYKWMNMDAGSIVGNNADLLNVAPGNYQLQVSNQYGCSKISPVIVVPQAAFTGIDVTGVNLRDALCAQPNGMVKINSFNKDSSLFTFRWVDSAAGQLTGTGTAIYNLHAATYQLYARDSNACEKIIFTPHINSLPVPSFDYTGLLQSNDNCNLQQGSITALKVNGLVGPTTYTWYNQLNTVAGNTINLQNAAAGTYTLQVMDAGVCNIQSAPFTITNSDNALALLMYDDLVVPRYSDASIKIKNTAPGMYSLSLLADGTTVAQQNNNGNFVVPKITMDTSFYIKRNLGNCLSPVVKVNIKVVDKSYFAVPNAFTPNRDGKNDRLSVKVVGYAELHYFRIFNRFGILIFETQKINDGWDGYLKGMLQDAGGYVWVAQGKDINGKTVTGRGSFILIR